MKKITLLVTVFVLFSCKSIIQNSSDTLNLKKLHTENIAVQTSILFEPAKKKVVSLQIAKNEQLAEHITDVPALLVCVSGNAVYNDEKGQKINLRQGDYVKIESNVKHSINAIEESNFLLIK